MTIFASFQLPLELLLGNLDDRSDSDHNWPRTGWSRCIDDQRRQASGAEDKQLDGARNFQRKAQFYLDFLEAENSTGFHTPQEAASILGESIDAARKGQLAAQKVK